MKLVQQKNHRENKQTVQKRQQQYSRSWLYLDNHTGTEVTFMRFAIVISTTQAGVLVSG
jgi:hypothetical protein